MASILPYVPRALPHAFTLRDLEHHITQHRAGGFGNNPSRIATNTLQHWIKTHAIKRAGAGKTGAGGIPLFVRAREQKNPRIAT